MTKAGVATIVSGLPRSGTSLMMQMLAAGGLPALTDGQRRADVSNPKGYYELEAVKRTREDSSWLERADGHCVKMISMLLYDLPPDRQYKILFMTRAIEEVLASQSAMLKDRKESQGPDDGTMRRHYETHLRKLEPWLKSQANMSVLYCSYNALVRNPREEAGRVLAFLALPLDVERMTASVDPELYRQRKRT